MSGGLDALFDLQREVLRLQQQQIDAAQAMIRAGGDVVKAQESGQQAVRAVVEANRAWLRLWGWK